MNVIACESSEFDFNLIDMKREFFTTYLPYILIRASKSTNRLPQLQLNNYITRADYAILAAKPRPVNTKFSAQTNENDYVDEEEEETTISTTTKAASEQPQSQTQRQPQQQTQVKQQAQKTTTNNSEKQIMKKGTYLYDDLLGDSPIDPF
jgi:polysaccharide pyruvyl transferase WcaK-like protein